jgi:hypothetical protein
LATLIAACAPRSRFSSGRSVWRRHKPKAWNRFRQRHIVPNPRRRSVSGFRLVLRLAIVAAVSPGAVAFQIGTGAPPSSFTNKPISIHAGVLLFHKAKSPSPFHSIDSVDNLISIEDRDEPVHCPGGVPWAWRDVFSEDAPGILHRSQYSL